MDGGIDAARFWPPSALPVAFSASPSSASSAPSSADVAAEAEVALRTWSEVPCTSFRARYAGERAAVAADDGVNVIIVHGDTWPATLTPGAVAETVVSLDESGQIHDADIHLNAVDHHFSLDGSPATQDLRSVLVHEIGHALGLGHSTDPRATMAVAGSGLRWRSLEAEDRSRVCTLYPGLAAERAPRCDEIPCPSGLVCVAGVCQRPGDRADVCSPCERVPGACEAAGDEARCIDVGEGAAAGRVCGRACSLDRDCGAGFACRPTTEAGDLQCISVDGCRSGANRCATDADCTDSVCRGGACVGAVPTGTTDAGAPRTTEDVAAPIATGGGCACSTSSLLATGASPLAAVLVALALLRRRLRHA